MFTKDRPPTPYNRQRAINMPTSTSFESLMNFLGQKQTSPDSITTIFNKSRFYSPIHPEEGAELVKDPKEERTSRQSPYTKTYPEVGAEKASGVVTVSHNYDEEWKEPVIFPAAVSLQSIAQLRNDCFSPDLERELEKPLSLVDSCYCFTNEEFLELEALAQQGRKRTFGFFYDDTAVEANDMGAAATSANEM